MTSLLWLVRIDKALRLQNFYLLKVVVGIREHNHYSACIWVNMYRL